MDFYGTIAGADEYHETMLNVSAGTWPSAGIADDKKKAALVRASRVIDGQFGSLYTGSKATSTQRLAWPRVDAYDSCASQELASDYVPDAIIEATYELALIEIQNPGSLAPSVDLSRVTKSESVDGAASRSFFSPNELGLGDAYEAYRPKLTYVTDLVGCYLAETDYWAAAVV